MRTAWKLLGGLLAVLVVFLLVNKLTVDRETKRAEVNVPGGELMRLEGGTVQVVEEGPTGAVSDPESAGIPIVLIHCFTCSLRWWDRTVPLLTEEHRVVRIDLLGHGGSEKPAGGYEVANQASLVAQVMGRLELGPALVVGHSLGGGVATAVAEASSELVDRVVIIGSPPSEEARKGYSLPARIAGWPLIGQAAWRFTPDFVRRSEIEDNAFAKDFDPADGFAAADQPLEDLKAMTYSAFDDSPDAFHDYIDERPLPVRMRETAVPALVIFGSEDALIDLGRAEDDWALAPGATLELIDGSGHSPNVEAVDRTAALIADFAGEATPRAPLGGDGRRRGGEHEGRPRDRRRGGGGAPDRKR